MGAVLQSLTGAGEDNNNGLIRTWMRAERQQTERVVGQLRQDMQTQFTTLREEIRTQINALSATIQQSGRRGSLAGLAQLTPPAGRYSFLGSSAVPAAPAAEGMASLSAGSLPPAPWTDRARVEATAPNPLAAFTSRRLSGQLGQVERSMSCPQGAGGESSGPVGTPTSGGRPLPPVRIARSAGTSPASGEFIPLRGSEIKLEAPPVAASTPSDAQRQQGQHVQGSSIAPATPPTGQGLSIRIPPRVPITPPRGGPRHTASTSTGGFNFGIPPGRVGPSGTSAERPASTVERRDPSMLMGGFVFGGLQRDAGASQPSSTTAMFGSTAGPQPGGTGDALPGSFAPESASTAQRPIRPLPSTRSGQDPAPVQVSNRTLGNLRNLALGRQSASRHGSAGSREPSKEVPSAGGSRLSAEAFSSVSRGQSGPGPSGHTLDLPPIEAIATPQRWSTRPLPGQDVEMESSEEEDESSGEDDPDASALTTLSTLEAQRQAQAAQAAPRGGRRGAATRGRARAPPAKKSQTKGRK